MSQNGPKVIIIKKKAKGHGHHGGAWKVAYADFVTAMMALFIVLWLLTQTDQSSREKIAQYFRTGMLPGGSLVHGGPAGSNPPMAINVIQAPVPGKTGAEVKRFNTLAQEVQAALKHAAADPGLSGLQEHVKVKIVDEGALIELVDGGDSFMFSVSSSELKPQAQYFLERLAPLLAAVPNKIEIHGHTDARPFGGGQKGKSNWTLSFERANAARNVLEANGLPSGQVNAVLAHADTALYKPDDPLAPENRRLSILVVRNNFLPQREGRKPTAAELEMQE